MRFLKINRPKILFTIPFEVQQSILADYTGLAMDFQRNISASLPTLYWRFRDWIPFGYGIDKVLGKNKHFVYNFSHDLNNLFKQRGTFTLSLIHLMVSGPLHLALRKVLYNSIS